MTDADTDRKLFYILWGMHTMEMAIRTFPRAVAACAVIVMISACAQTPMGATVQVMPGPGKSFDAFVSDQSYCKWYASSQVQGQAEASNQRAFGTAALGTLLGAGLGAAVGGAAGNAGLGAAIGASTGAGGGAILAGSNGQYAQANIQAQYDNAYAQCMYSKGNQVPGFASAQITYHPGLQQYGEPDPALVVAVQTELVRQGFLSEPPDGVLGPHTRSAIYDFEARTGLPVDGNVSHRLLARLNSTTYSGIVPVAVASPPSPSQAQWLSPAP